MQKLKRFTPEINFLNNKIKTKNSHKIEKLQKIEHQTNSKFIFIQILILICLVINLNLFVFTGNYFLKVNSANIHKDLYILNTIIFLEIFLFFSAICIFFLFYFTKINLPKYSAYSYNLLTISVIFNIFLQGYITQIFLDFSNNTENKEIILLVQVSFIYIWIFFFENCIIKNLVGYFIFFLVIFFLDLRLNINKFSKNINFILYPIFLIVNCFFTNFFFKNFKKKKQEYKENISSYKDLLDNLDYSIVILKKEGPMFYNNKFYKNFISHFKKSNKIDFPKFFDEMNKKSIEKNIQEEVCETFSSLPKNKEIFLKLLIFSNIYLFSNQFNPQISKAIIEFQNILSDLNLIFLLNTNYNIDDLQIKCLEDLYKDLLNFILENLHSKTFKFMGIRNPMKYFSLKNENCKENVFIRKNQYSNNIEIIFKKNNKITPKNSLFKTQDQEDLKNTIFKDLNFPNNKLNNNYLLEEIKEENKNSELENSLNNCTIKLNISNEKRNSDEIKFKTKNPMNLNEIKLDIPKIKINNDIIDDISPEINFREKKNSLKFIKRKRSSVGNYLNRNSVKSIENSTTKKSYKIEFIDEIDFDEIKSDDSQKKIILDKIFANIIKKICHELRNPILNIIEISKIVKKEASVINTKLFDSLKSIKNLAFFMNMNISDFEFLNTTLNNKNYNDLIVNLREKYVNKNTEYDFKKQIKKIQKIFENKISFMNKKIRLNISFDLEFPDKLTFDYEINLINHIIYIILNNSLKFSLNGDIDLKILYDKKTEILILKLLDQGIGIKDENIQYIGQQFYKVEKNNNNYGLGMGLFTVKSIVDALDGFFELESNYGIGTKIIIKIPLLIKDQQNNDYKLFLNNLTIKSSKNNFDTIYNLADNPDLSSSIDKEQFSIISNSVKSNLSNPDYKLCSNSYQENYNSRHSLRAKRFNRKKTNDILIKPRKSFYLDKKNFLKSFLRRNKTEINLGNSIKIKNSNSNISNYNKTFRNNNITKNTNYSGINNFNNNSNFLNKEYSDKSKDIDINLVYKNTLRSSQKLTRILTDRNFKIGNDIKDIIHRQKTKNFKSYLTKKFPYDTKTQKSEHVSFGLSDSKINIYNFNISSFSNHFRNINSFNSSAFAYSINSNSYSNNSQAFSSNLCNNKNINNFNIPSDLNQINNQMQNKIKENNNINSNNIPSNNILKSITNEKGYKLVKNPMPIFEEVLIRILVVDDEDLIRRGELNIIKKFSEKNKIKIEVEECKDGVECLFKLYMSFLNGFKYDMIITDETMDFMKGSMLCRIIKDLIRDNVLYDIGTVMITSYDKTTIENSNFSKFIDFVGTKPLTVNIFEQIFFRFLSSYL